MKFKSFLPVIIFGFVAFATSQTLQNFSSGFSGGTVANATTFSTGPLTLTTGQYSSPDGTCAAPTYSFTNQLGMGVTRQSANILGLSASGSCVAGVINQGFAIPSGNEYAFLSGAFGTAQDSGFDRVAASIIGTNNGTAGQNGWLQQRAARIGLAADYTNATAGLTATNLSVTLIAGRKYNFVAELFLSNSTAAEGATVAFDGGGATVTNFRVQGELYNQAPTLLLVSAATALATTHTIASLVVTTQCHWRFAGTFEVLAAGTFIIRASENSHAAGTLTINRGSFLWIEDMIYN